LRGGIIEIVLFSEEVRVVHHLIANTDKVARHAANK
jgi:hypothetical protein